MSPPGGPVIANVMSMASGDSEGRDAHLLGPHDVGRFQVVEMPPDTQGRQRWGVVDHTTNRWVEAGGEVDIYFLKDAATQCVRRLRYLTATHLGRP